ncbi:uncharacterized protein LOC141628538 [Silene latifolia]|uniref:uncharacterized protein LOC141628538 n=1 Tax=Silene latifolia TaxID=37657 RepID=UPI003D772AA3
MDVSPMFRSLGFVKYAGVDPMGSAGGLWIGWRKEVRFSFVESFPNFVILMVEKYNGLPCYLVLFYGAPYVNLRLPILQQLEESLENLEHPFLIVGEFNQVEYTCDKLSSNKSKIPGAYEFSNWKIRNELLDIPFKGPRFTWCNNRKGDKRVYERIDKALGSKDWFTFFPETGIKHFPIQISDHAPIEVDLNLTKNSCKKPYKIDAWALEYPECLTRVVRKLSGVRQAVKRWSMDKREEWLGKWDDFDKRLEEGMELACGGGPHNSHDNANANVSTPTAEYGFEGVLKHLKTKVLEDDLDVMGSPFTAKEVRRAVFQMGPMKSPGPDGIPAILLPKKLQFKPACGLRQGDPLSRYLFLLCMEVLSINIVHAQEVGVLRGIRICQGVRPLTHLFFADDSIFFIQDRGNAIRSLKRILDKYCAASGQALNEEKCGIVYSPSMKLCKIRTCIKVFKLKKHKGVGKYHGMPTEFHGSMKEIFKGLIENVTKRISSWNGVFLAPAGRFTLINSVLSNISNYFLSVFKIPRPPEPKGDFLPPVFNFLKDLRIRDLCLINGGWNQDLINMLFDDESSKRILAIPLRINDGKDEIIWPFSSTGLYTVKSGYGLLFTELFMRKGTSLHKSRLNQGRKKFCGKRLWHFPIPQSWKILTNSLPVGGEFVRRNLTWNPLCPLCRSTGESVETVDHLFKECSITARIWAGSQLGINTEQAYNLEVGDWIVNWIQYLRTFNDWQIRIIQFSAIIASIWNLRNNVIFRGEMFNPKGFFSAYTQLVTFAMKGFIEKDEATSAEHGTVNNDDLPDVESDLVRNGHPVYVTGGFGSCSIVRVMVDASWEKTWVAAWGWIAYDENGNVIYKGGEKGRAESPLQAEALGVLKAIQWAFGNNFLHVELSSDCLQFVFQCAGLGSKHYQIKEVLEDIFCLTPNFHYLCFSYVCRKNNVEAHLLARRAMTMA